MLGFRQEVHHPAQPEHSISTWSLSPNIPGTRLPKALWTQVVPHPAFPCGPFLMSSARPQTILIFDCLQFPGQSQLLHMAPLPTPSLSRQHHGPRLPPGFGSSSTYPLLLGPGLSQIQLSHNHPRILPEPNSDQIGLCSHPPCGPTFYTVIVP